MTSSIFRQMTPAISSGRSSSEDESSLRLSITVPRVAYSWTTSNSSSSESSSYGTEEMDFLAMVMTLKKNPQMRKRQ